MEKIKLVFGDAIDAEFFDIDDRWLSVSFYECLKTEPGESRWKVSTERYVKSQRQISVSSFGNEETARKEFRRRIDKYRSQCVVPENGENENE